MVVLLHALRTLFQRELAYSVAHLLLAQQLLLQLHLRKRYWLANTPDNYGDFSRHVFQLYRTMAVSPQGRSSRGVLHLDPASLFVLSLHRWAGRSIRLLLDLNNMGG